MHTTVFTDYIFVAGDGFCCVCHCVQLGATEQAVQPTARWNLWAGQVKQLI